MKKAILESKWWFYIPIISLLFLNKISKWVLDGETFNDRCYRDILMSCAVFIHVIPIYGIITYFTK